MTFPSSSTFPGQETFPGLSAPVVQQGSWWGLVSVMQQNRQEFEAFVSRAPMACPVCGEPLSPPPNTKAGAPMELYCKYAGDHHYQYPRDWHAPVRPGPGY